MKSRTNCGIYKIENITDGKVYVGSSSNLKSRKNQHFKSLKNGKHPNRHLQSAFNRDKENSFIWEVIEEIEKYEDIEKLKKELYLKENYWMGKLKICTDGACNDNYGYNLSPSAESNLGLKFSEESIQKLRDSHVGPKPWLRGRKLSEEHRGKIGLKSIDRVSKKVINLTTNEIFNSAMEAAKIYSTDRSSIIKVCKGKRKTAAKQEWSYYKGDTIKNDDE